MHMFCGDQCPLQRSLSTCKHGHIGFLRQLANDAGIFLCQIQWDISRNGGDAQDMHILWAGKCKQDCNGIILTRICINDYVTRCHVIPLGYPTL